MTRDSFLAHQHSVEVAQHLICEKASAMYRQLPNVLIFTFVAASALALYFQGAASQLSLFLWWGGMQLVNVLRLGSLWWWHRTSRQQRQNPAQMVRLFMIGSLVSGVGWAAFSIAYFHDATTPQRLVIALVMATIAAGSINVLALVPWVSRLFMIMLIGPLVILFATTGAMSDLVVAGLGLALFIGLSGFARVSRDTAFHLFVAARDKDRITADAAGNYEELARAKDNLELRLAEQIETLEFEIALKERYAQELARVASSDPLTGLLNRSSFERELCQQIEVARTNRGCVGVFAIEVLRFDVIELQGAVVSEQILLVLAERLKSVMPPGSLIARWGGSEFAVTMTSQGRKWAQEAALLRGVFQQPIETGAGVMRIDVMIGVSVFPGEARDAEQLLYQTSIARHSLRQQGTGGVKLFDLALDVGIQQRQRLRRSLHSALEADELSLVFQPIEPCGYSVARKMEALLRWDEPELGTISPLLFIPVAEESGLIVPLGRWVLVSACKAAAHWPGGTVVSVNVSIHQILGGDLLADVKAALAISGLAPERLEIEITESVFSHDIGLVCSVLERIRTLGVSLAIDDFGTGYSSLAYLRKLPVNIIKVDRSFIADLDHDARKLLLAIVGMARGLGFRIVVEGVETEQQRNLLVAMGGDYLQGYLISRPIAAGSVADWLSAPNLLSR
ncbi:putative bifunctional diguanylate cyclase/phosphodiesterase [Cellvibrio sp. OA-2007]|uniref:putative bifunctional diguanylate cyclase/phosphodiesterase n=1 Tax=Cellvibrio sp. OA-2007 TaxID=529823 RepID=UPI00078589B6|nr:GGDEF domain-containing phosphodiesterase [Cellvibrio sp. OA-2007]